MNDKLILLTTLVILLTSLTVFFVFTTPDFGFIFGDSGAGLIQSAFSEELSREPIAVSAIEPNYFPIRNFNIADPEVNATAAGIYDNRSNRFLYAKNIDSRLPIASITKLMSAVVVMEKLDLDRIVTVTVENINVDGNGADLYRDEKLYVSDLLKMMLIRSSNDAALTIAARAKEKGVDFVFEMNKKAMELGMTDTHFNDPAGLSDDAFSTVADLVKLLNYSTKYDKIWSALSTQKAEVFSIDGKISHNFANTNTLLGELPEVVGGKTGFTDGAKGTMVLLITHENSELISIILGSDDRFGETKKIISWAKEVHKWR